MDSNIKKYNKKYIGFSFNNFLAFALGMTIMTKARVSATYCLGRRIAKYLSSIPTICIRLQIHRLRQQITHITHITHIAHTFTPMRQLH